MWVAELELAGPTPNMIQLNTTHWSVPVCLFFFGHRLSRNKVKGLITNQHMRLYDGAINNPIIEFGSLNLLAV